MVVGISSRLLDDCCHFPGGVWIVAVISWRLVNSYLSFLVGCLDQCRSFLSTTHDHNVRWWMDGTLLYFSDCQACTTKTPMGHTVLLV